MCLPQTLLMPAKREFYILQSCCCSNCYLDPVPDGCLDGPSCVEVNQCETCTPSSRRDVGDEIASMAWARHI